MLKIGFHILPKEEQLFDILGRKIRKEGGGTIMASADDDFPFPVIDRDLYSREPWELFTNEDPWEVDDSGEKTIKRTVYVFATLKVIGKKRFVRIAGPGTWDGSTGEKPVHDDGSDRLVIGSKRYLDYKPKQESLGTRETFGHWMMHEYRLAGESLKGLETTLLPLANVRVLCKISQVVDKGSLAESFWPKETLDRCLEEYISQGLFETITSNEDSQLAATNKREFPDQEILQQENPKRRRIMKNPKEEKGYSTNSSTQTESETKLFDSKEEEEEFALYLENSLTEIETCLFESKKEEENIPVNMDKSLTETETCNLFDLKEKEEEEFPVIVDNSLTKTDTCNLFDSKEEEEKFAAFVANSLTEIETRNLFNSKEEEEEYAVFLDTWLNE